MSIYIPLNSKQAWALAREMDDEIFYAHIFQDETDLQLLNITLFPKSKAERARGINIRKIQINKNGTVFEGHNS